MIENFRHRGLKRLYERGDKSQLRPDIADKAELYLSVLDAAEELAELDITGFVFILSQETCEAFIAYSYPETTGSSSGLKMEMHLILI